MILLHGSAFFFPRFVCKITHDDWLLNGPIFYRIELPGPIRLLFRTGEFWQENLRAYFNEIYVELIISMLNILDNKMCWDSRASFVKVIIV